MWKQTAVCFFLYLVQGMQSLLLSISSCLFLSKSLTLSLQIIGSVGLSVGLLVVIICMYLFLRVTDGKEYVITKQSKWETGSERRKRREQSSSSVTVMKSVGEIGVKMNS